MPSLQTLKLSRGHFKPGALLPLGSVVTLTRLELGTCIGLFPEDLQVISSLQLLRYLDLTSAAALRDSNTEHLMLSSLQRLTALILSDNEGLTDAIAMQLCRMTSLRLLDVRECPGISERALDQVYLALPRMQKLLSGDCKIVPC